MLVSLLGDDLGLRLCLCCLRSNWARCSCNFSKRSCAKARDFRFGLVVMGEVVFGGVGSVLCEVGEECEPMLVVDF